MPSAADVTRFGIKELYEQLAPARDWLSEHDDEIVRTQIALSEIPAPTGHEAARGAAVEARFHRMGLSDIRVDEVGNVIGRRRGQLGAAPVVVCSHLDTVFPEGTPVTVTRDGTQLCGPGIVDNSRGLAAMLALAEVLDGVRVRPQRDIIFAATVGEEGLGDLRGAKHLFSQFPVKPASCIALDGAGDERIVTRALGARRFRITFSGPGGHSWSSFGTPNPIHAAGATAAKLASLPLTRSPRTTLSVCRIGGGVSINAIPGDAWLEVDVRSSSTDALARTSLDVERAVQAAEREENGRRGGGMPRLTSAIEIIGDRPCGDGLTDHPLVRAAVFATSHVGCEPDLAAASTDANIPISLGIPAIAIGAGGRGGGTHTATEWYDNSMGARGIARALTVLVAASGLPAAH